MNTTMKCKIHLLPGLLLILCLNSCGFLWNMCNREDLEKDMRELLSRYSIVPDNFICRMVETTRCGICEFKMSQDELVILIDNLNLIEVEEINEIDFFPDNEIIDDLYNNSNVLIYKTEIRPQNLKFSSGRNFEYVILIYNIKTDHIIILISYAYG